MRKLILAIAAAALLAAPMATAVRAEDTTVIKRHDDGDKTIIKKRDEPAVLPLPHVEEHKTIIKKED
jgi:Ni/Co efflux regulator RcnB